MRKLKNDKERKAFLENYRSWELESEDMKHGIRFWAIDLGIAKIYTEEKMYEKHKYSQRYADDVIVDHKTGEKLFAIWMNVSYFLDKKTGKHIFNNMRVSETDLVDWMRENKNTLAVPDYN